MSFTRIVTLFLILAVPCTAYAQQSKKPRQPSRTTPAPQPQQERPSPPPPSQPRMSPEKAFYYFVAIYGAPNDVVDRYGKYFDASNYKVAMADEFERNRYKERIRARIADEVRKIDFSDKFTLIGEATLGEYSFGSHSFPVVKFPEFVTCVAGLGIFPSCPIPDVSQFRVRDAVNRNDFNWSVPMSETDARAFVKSRSAVRPGAVDRRITVRITYSVVNKKGWYKDIWSDDPYRGRTFSPFIYSVEAYGDKSLTAKLGVIPKVNPLGASTAEELRVATVAAQTATKEIGKYQNMIEYREKSSGGKIFDPLRPMPSRPQLFGTITLTDVGISLLEEQPGDVPTKKQLNFFDSPTANLWRENESEWWDPNAKRVARKYGVDKEIYRVHWQKRSGGNYESFRFDNKQERDRFFVDLSRAFQEWKTKYTPFQFAAGELTIEQRCEVGTRFVPCP